jgi:hypothetical protein
MVYVIKIFVFLFIKIKQIHGKEEKHPQRFGCFFESTKY